MASADCQGPIALAGHIPDPPGSGVSIFGDELVVGAPYDDTDAVDGGSVYLFERSGSRWTGPGTWIPEGTPSATAAPATAGDHLGESMVVDLKLFAITQPDGDLQGSESGGRRPSSSASTSSRGT